MPQLPQLPQVKLPAITRLRLSESECDPGEAPPRSTYKVRPPRVEGAVLLDDGRRMGFAEYGPPDGKPVLWFHGTPGAKRQIPPELRVKAHDHGVRVVAVERPGVGLSTLHAYDSLLDWTDDIAQVVDQLGIDRFAVVGLSGGGPYALACAYRFPERVVGTAIIGGVAPTQGDDAVVGGLIDLAVRYAPIIRVLRDPLSKVMWLLLRGSRPLASPLFDLFVAVAPEGDKEVFGTPGMKEMFTDDLIRGARTQFGAVIYDVVLFGQHWGFSPRDIEVPTLFWHGTGDNIVPVAHGEHLAELVPGAELRVHEGGGHLANLSLADEVLDALVELWQRA